MPLERERGAMISEKIYVGIDKQPKVGSFSLLGRLSIVTRRCGGRMREKGKEQKEKEEKKKRRARGERKEQEEGRERERERESGAMISGKIYVRIAADHAPGRPRTPLPVWVEI